MSLLRDLLEARQSELLTKASESRNRTKMANEKINAALIYWREMIAKIKEFLHDYNQFLKIEESVVNCGVLPEEVLSGVISKGERINQIYFNLPRLVIRFHDSTVLCKILPVTLNMLIASSDNLPTREYLINQNDQIMLYEEELQLFMSQVPFTKENFEIILIDLFNLKKNTHSSVQ